MSKFIDKLTLSEAAPAPMGFTSQKVSREKPKMQLVAVLSPGAEVELCYADAVLVKVNTAAGLKKVAKLCEAEEKTPYGAWFGEIGSKDAEKLSEAGCDFAVFPAGTPLSVKMSEKLGKVLELDPALTDDYLLAVEDLPVDAVLATIKPEKDFLTMSDLISIQRLVALVGKPLLLSSSALTPNDLQPLWDAGVKGLVVSAEGEGVEEKLKLFHQAIDELAVPKKRKKAAPIVPRISIKEEPPPREDEEEDE